jgi:hypothetical protein
MYHAKWKSMGVKVYALAKETEGKKADWYEFMQKAGMKGKEGEEKKEESKHFEGSGQTLRKKKDSK